MRKNRQEVDPIPEEFASYEEAGRFWDEHDMSDYPDDFSDVDFDVELRGRRFEIDIDEDVMAQLRTLAAKTRTGPGRLASRLLRRGLKKVGA